MTDLVGKYHMQLFNCLNRSLG